MMDSETLRYIKLEIAKAMNVLLSGAVGGQNDSFNEDIDEVYPGMPTLTKRPVMHPYGFVSRATQGVISVVGRMGDHPGNRFVLGHRDKDRPAVEQGEAKLYNASGEVVYLRKDGTTLISQKIKLGSEDADEPLVLGKQLQTLLSNILAQLKSQADQLNTVATDLATHTHPTAAPGSPSPPTTAATYVAAAAQFMTDSATFDMYKSSPVDDGAILSEKAFTEKGSE